ncbi:tetratricopeptide repeat protein [Ectothiorhodospiraceae bacterium 2226]|nr:tetratricopeptide repeat protein [Ectothiorhodospiraceae bacterium 2226]
MKRLRLLILLTPALASCAVSSGGDTLAQLRDVKFEIKEEAIEGGLERAMASYQRFLEETPESAMTPEAIRRLADLKIEAEYGFAHAGGAGTGAGTGASAAARAAAPAPERAARVGPAPERASPSGVAAAMTESEQAFEDRATASDLIATTGPEGDAPLPEGLDGDLENAAARDAIALYQDLLDKYPLYERNDQVLYQMSRAHAEIGEVETAMDIMTRIVEEYPRSRYLDEVQFRRGEYFYTRNRYLDAEDAYQSVVRQGVSSAYYEMALYKLGWVFYKQDLYEDALHRFVGVLDYKVSVGYDFEQTENTTEKTRVDDTYRVISLSFSNIGGPEAVRDYFKRHGARSYEDGVYSSLGEYYLSKRRFSDAAGAYKTFVGLYPLHRKSPHFHMRVVEIYEHGNFPRLVLAEKKEFAQVYGVRANYWRHFDLAARPEVVAYLKGNLKDLANHYHALYQDERFADDQPENYAEALLWYREFLGSFPEGDEAPAINYQLAELQLEHGAFGEAAREFERTAYDYPLHAQAPAAGYAAVYAYQQQVEVVPPARLGLAKRELIRSSLKFVDTFPRHEQAPTVLGAAADDLYELKDFEGAANAGRKLIASYPSTTPALLRSAWIVVAHASFDMGAYEDAEQAYAQVLRRTDLADDSRPGFIDNLAASIYKQGEQANVLGDYRTAANHFLRIGRAAPTSKFRAGAEYDASVALIRLEDWSAAASVLVDFRERYPGHELQPDVTNKLAHVYREAGQLASAAAEYERVERETDDDEIRRGALLVAADLYEEAGDDRSALRVYRRYVDFFPRPLELALETRFKIATLHKDNNEQAPYLEQLRAIVTADAGAGAERTDRTRYLGATSALVLAEPLYERFAAIRLVHPFEKHLQDKQQAMRAALNGFADLTHYEVGEVTAAATFYMAEVYYGFARALIDSERPANLSALELEEFELAIEEQAFPFEDKAIEVHEKNLELMGIGIYNAWIDRSLGKLAVLVPVRYAKPEESSGFVASLGPFRYGADVEEDAAEAVEAEDGASHAEADGQGRGAS